MKIESVECTSASKGKQQEYVLRVTTSEGEHDIVRTYGTLFDFRGSLAKTHGKAIPELPALSWYERFRGGEKKRKQITDFCKTILDLPEEISQGKEVVTFFEKWPSDSCSAAIDDLKEPVDNKRKSGEPKQKALVKQASADQHMSGDLMAELKKTVADGPTKRLSAGPKNTENAAKKASQRGSLPHAPLERTRSDGEAEEELSKYMVIADHTPQQHDELELSKGDMVIVVEKHFLGWWLVHHADKDGWAPAAKLQALNEAEDEEDLTDTQPAQMSEPCPVYEAMSDFVARSPDEVSYAKNQQVEVLSMQNDGWWKVRSKETGRVGMAPAVNLARLSDGSQSGDPLYSDISAYSQQSVYKKRTPPRRNSSHRMSLSELYAKVDVTTRTKPPGPHRHISEETDAYDNDDELYSPVNKPAVPPKKPGLTGLRYSEIEFTQEQKPSASSKPQPPRFKIRESEPRVTYSEIEVTPATAPASQSPPDDQHVYGNVKPPPMPGYMNVDRTMETPADKYFQLKADYSPALKHSEGLPANKGDIVKILRDSQPNVLCLMCLKEGENTKPSEGWIPKELLTEVKIEVMGLSEHNVPIVCVAGEETEESVYLTAILSQKEPKKPGWRKRDDRKAEWFAGMLSRAECETLMKDAKEGQFLVREKADEAEPFSITVFYQGTHKHFKIYKKEECKYEVGGHCFKNISHIIRHYTKYPLFKGKDDKEEKLGKPFILPKRSDSQRKEKLKKKSIDQ